MECSAWNDLRDRLPGSDCGRLVRLERHCLLRYPDFTAIIGGWFDQSLCSWRTNLFDHAPAPFYAGSRTESQPALGVSLDVFLSSYLRYSSGGGFPGPGCGPEAIH